MIFADREQAGQLLAQKLAAYAGRSDVLILALPRGGVPVGYEVAHALGVAMDIFIVRKIGVPGHEELAMGAIASGGTVVLNPDVVSMLAIDQQTFNNCAARELLELQRREQTYRAGKMPRPLQDKICLLVDDGIATGASMQAAVTAVRQQKPKQVIVAAPVASSTVKQQFAAIADDVVTVQMPADFGAVGLWYESFPQLTDDEVRYILGRANFGDFPWQPGAEPPPAFR